MDHTFQQIISTIEQTLSYDDVQYTYLFDHIEHNGFENAFQYIMYSIGGICMNITID